MASYLVVSRRCRRRSPRASSTSRVRYGFVGIGATVLVLAAVAAVTLAFPSAGRAAACKPIWTAATGAQVGQHWAKFLDVAAVSSTDVWAVGIGGGALAEHWDGTGWSIVPTPQPGIGYQSELRGVAAISPSDIWAVGLMRPDLASETTTLIEHWDGFTWSVVASPAPPPRPDVDPRLARVWLVDVSAVAPDDVWAVGNADGRTLIEHWNGREWSIVPSPSPGAYSNALEGIAVRTSGDIWAVGSYAVTSSAATPNDDLTEHWDGNAWKVVPAAGVYDGARHLDDVTMIGADDIWAAGGYETAHWDGATWAVAWTPFPPNAGGQLFALAALGRGDVWGVGNTGLIAHWDGTEWRAIPVPALLAAWGPGPVLYGAAATPSGEIWAVGDPPGSRPGAARLCPVRVSDAGFSEPSASSAQGSGVAWSFPATNANAHSVTDASALGLFDSGLRAPGGSFTTTLIAAGKYTIRDSATGTTSMIKVPLKVRPTSGSTATSFTLTWASETPPAGYAFDVQVKRPGTTAYAYWRSSTTETSGAFVPDGATGTYSFRARYRSATSSGASGWSSAIAITVS
jgi:hypothetical protein